MNRNQPEPGIPCGVCTETVHTWTPLPHDGYRAEPCGHTLDEIGEEWVAALARRVPVADP